MDKQETGPDIEAQPFPRDPQGFVHTDVVAWRVVAFIAGGVAIAGAAAAIIVLAVLAG